AEASSTVTAEEVASSVARSQEEGILEDEVGLLTGALEFSGFQAEQVMVPLDAVVSLASGVNVGELEDAVTRTGFSRFPIHNEAREIIGYLHVKDTLYAKTDEERAEPVPSWRIRGLPSARVADDIEDVLTLMQH